MKKSSKTEMSTQKSKDSVTSPSATQKPVAATGKPDAAGVVKDLPAKASPEVAQSATAAADAPVMHAAQGNDDIMSQPQLSPTGKKKS